MTSSLKKNKQINKTTFKLKVYLFTDPISDILSRSCAGSTCLRFSAEGICSSLSSDWSIPAHNTHTVHTHLVGFYQFELCVLPSVYLIWAYFFLWAILSAFRPLSLSEQVKNKDPPKIATKVTPPFIHSSVCPPSSLLLTRSSPSTQRQEGSVQSIPLSLFLSLSLFICCFTGGVLLPCFTCNRVQLSTVLVFNSQSQYPQLSW